MVRGMVLVSFVNGPQDSNLINIQISSDDVSSKVYSKVTLLVGSTINALERHRSPPRSSNPPHILRYSQHLKGQAMSEDISNVHLMIVDKVSEAILNPQPSIAEFDQEMSGSKSEDIVMSDPNKPDDIMTLD